MVQIACNYARAMRLVVENAMLVSNVCFEYAVTWSKLAQSKHRTTQTMNPTFFTFKLLQIPSTVAKGELHVWNKCRPHIHPHRAPEAPPTAPQPAQYAAMLPETLLLLLHLLPAAVQSQHAK